jgi:hypothetical protein
MFFEHLGREPVSYDGSFSSPDGERLSMLVVCPALRSEPISWEKKVFETQSHVRNSYVAHSFIASVECRDPRLQPDL